MSPSRYVGAGVIPESRWKEQVLPQCIATISIFTTSHSSFLIFLPLRFTIAGATKMRMRRVYSTERERETPPSAFRTGQHQIRVMKTFLAT